MGQQVLRVYKALRECREFKGRPAQRVLKECRASKE
jgi:hypothetical protein